MQSIIIILLIIGIIMVIDGIYREEITKLKQEKKIEYKFIPRSMYEDALYSDNLKGKYANIFDGEHDTRSGGRFE